MCPTDRHRRGRGAVGLVLRRHGDRAVASTPVLTETQGARGLTVELPPGWQAAPSTLTPKLSDPREVLSVGFSDGGRHFHVDVAFGPQASPDVRRQAWAILDSLHVDPAVRPDWPSAG